MQLYISIAGLAYFYLSNKHTLGAIFGRDLMSADALDERLAHMSEVVLGYVRADADGGSAAPPARAVPMPISQTTTRRPA